MKLPEPFFHRHSSTPSLGPFVFIILFLLASCTAGSYGRLQWSDEAIDLFESSQILKNHTYYYFGPEAEPEAIIAIDNRYVLAPSLWKKIDLTTQELSRWMERIDNQYRYLKEKYRGALIVDEQGNRLGIWYSMADWTVIKRGEENEVVIFTPDTSHFHRDIRDKDPSPATN